MAKTLTKFGGLPAGGADGQVATKQSSSDHDVAWETPSGGGGGATVVTESDNFTLDKDVHVDGCIVIMPPSAATNPRTVTLMPIANQPPAGYSVEIFISGDQPGGFICFNNATTDNLLTSTGFGDVGCRARLVYLGSNVWYAEAFLGNGYSSAGSLIGTTITNADA